MAVFAFNLSQRVDRTDKAVSELRDGLGQRVDKTNEAITTLGAGIDALAAKAETNIASVRSACQQVIISLMTHQIQTPALKILKEDGLIFLSRDFSVHFSGYLRRAKVRFFELGNV